MHNHVEDPREQPKRTVGQTARRASLDAPAPLRAQCAEKEPRMSALGVTSTVALGERQAVVAAPGRRARQALLTWTDAERLSVREAARVRELPIRCGAVPRPTTAKRSAPTRQRAGPPMTDPMLHSPVEAGKVLGIGRSSLYLLMQSGELAPIRIGRSRRIPVTALDELVNRLRDDEDPMHWPQRHRRSSA